MKRINLPLLSLLVVQLLAIVLVGQRVWADSTSHVGSFISPTIGTPNVTRFVSFVPVNRTLPSGTNITYSFAGSADNYATWTPAQPAAAAGIDLAAISQLKNSHYLKVAVYLIGTTTVSPSLTGFQVAYETTVETPSTVATPATSATTSPATSSSPAPVPATPSQTQTPTAIKTQAQVTPEAQPHTHLVTLADTQKVTKATPANPIQTLVSTGSSLWINLLIALLLSAATTWWFILRHLHHPDNLRQI